MCQLLFLFFRGTHIYLLRYIGSSRAVIVQSILINLQYLNSVRKKTVWFGTERVRLKDCRTDSLTLCLRQLIGISVNKVFQNCHLQVGQKNMVILQPRYDLTQQPSLRICRNSLHETSSVFTVYHLLDITAWQKMYMHLSQMEREEYLKTLQQ